MTLEPGVVYLLAMLLVILMKVVLFILGYKTIKLGYNLVSAGIKGEFKFKSELFGFKADLVSLSPGLLFVTLGILLMIFGIKAEKEVQVAAEKELAGKSRLVRPFADSTVNPGTNSFNRFDSVTTDKKK